MSLNAAELVRLTKVEKNLRYLAEQMEGSGSKNQLNRLLVLAQNELSKVTTRIEAVETKVEELLELARKLQ